jgi:hypothetical protein
VDCNAAHSFSFEVELRLFRVHRYFLVRDSVVFRDMLSFPPGSDTLREGGTDDRPIKLEGVSSESFADLLWMYYNP